jgi:DNA-binding Lrp family transcriptional regulator
MGMAGLVNINVAPGKFYDVAEELHMLEEIKNVWGAYGDVDLIAHIEGDEILSDVVIKKIHSIDGVINTSTTVLIPLGKE